MTEVLLQWRASKVVQMVVGPVVVCLVCHLDVIMNVLRKNDRNGYVIGEGND